MDITILSKKEISAGDFVKALFFVWKKALIPCLAIALFYLLIIAAGVVAWFVATAFLPAALSIFVGGVVAAVLLLIFLILTFSVVRVCFNIASSQPAQIADSVSKSFKVFHRFLAALVIILAAGTAVFVPMNFITNKLILMPYTVLAALFIVIAGVYIMFCPWAIFLRDAKLGESFKYSFSIIKGKWMHVFLKVLIALGFTVALKSLLTLLMGAVAYAALTSSINDLVGAYKELGGYAILSTAKSLLVPSVITVTLEVFFSLFSNTLLLSSMTVLFINTELKERDVNATDAQGDLAKEIFTPASEPEENHDFTEIFKNTKAIDVTERISLDDNKSAIAPKNREEALREFQHATSANNDVDNSLPEGSDFSLIDYGFSDTSSADDTDDLMEILTDLPSSILNQDDK